MSDFEFVNDLPEGRGGPAGNPLFRRFSEALRARPGIWGIWPSDVKNPAGTAGQIRYGRYSAFPKGEYEARTINGVVYVRFIGEAA